MPKVGIEPTPSCEDRILNPARLPVPPLRQKNSYQLSAISYQLIVSPKANPKLNTKYQIPETALIIKKNYFFRRCDDIFLARAENRLDFAAVPADYGGQLVAAEIADGFGDGIEHYNVAGPEIAGYRFNALRQERFFLSDGGCCAVVDCDCAGRRAIEQPAKAIA